MISTKETKACGARRGRPRSHAAFVAVKRSMPKTCDTIRRRPTVTHESRSTPSVILPFPKDHHLKYILAFPFWYVENEEQSAPLLLLFILKGPCGPGSWPILTHVATHPPTLLQLHCIVS